MKLQQLVNVLLSIVFHVIVKKVFLKMGCTFKKCSSDAIMVKRIFTLSALQVNSSSPANSVNSQTNNFCENSFLSSWLETF